SVERLMLFGHVSRHTSALNCHARWSSWSDVSVFKSTYSCPSGPASAIVVSQGWIDSAAARIRSSRLMDEGRRSPSFASSIFLVILRPLVRKCNGVGFGDLNRRNNLERWACDDDALGARLQEPAHKLIRHDVAPDLLRLPFQVCVQCICHRVLDLPKPIVVLRPTPPLNVNIKLNGGGTMDLRHIGR